MSKIPLGKSKEIWYLYVQATRWISFILVATNQNGLGSAIVTTLNSQRLNTAKGVSCSLHIFNLGWMKLCSKLSLFQDPDW